MKTSGTLSRFLSSLEAVKVLEWEFRVGPPKVKHFWILGVNRFLKTYQVKKEESGPLPTHFAALTLRAATASALTQHLLTGWINYLFSVVTIEPNSTDERTAILCSWFHGNRVNSRFGKERCYEHQGNLDESRSN